MCERKYKIQGRKSRTRGRETVTRRRCPERDCFVSKRGPTGVEVEEGRERNV
jgi:hypothetical protein